VQVPFDTYFKVDTLKKYHRVMTMEDFMKNLAPVVWPPGKRTVFCYRSRGETDDCNAKEGNPFGPFWDTFNVDFDDSEFYGPLHYDVHHHQMSKKWNEKYPPEKFLVIAFTGAPASFPVQIENRELHKYLEWSETVNAAANTFVKSVMPKGSYVAIHLRNGIDWTRACEHVQHSPLLFSAPQCLGYNSEHGKVTKEMCFPSKEIILRQLKRVVKAMKAKSVFVASDNDHMINDINKALQNLKVKAYKLDKSDPHVDLAIMGRANHFIGNCVSSFTAFVKRERDVFGLPSSFWAFPPEGSGSSRNAENQSNHDEF
ncbi:GDP-fucose protein O-fucosyltransferase 1-like, partial [Limulus polyphemus]|uniref:GDP-fucose protein O-fucosyltransferase 1 n=1 Tax=Limulus polyphemus TaxID=6850 RepID=A0ABM1B4S0_LIMPO